MDNIRKQIYDDPEFNSFMLQKPSLTPGSIDTYIASLVRFVGFTGEPLYRTVHELRSMQNDRIENSMIIRFNPNQSRINIMQYEYIEYLRRQGCNATTISHYLRILRIFLSTVGIILPKKPKFNSMPREWYLLTKEDIRYVLNITSLSYKALITFAAATGLRLQDICSLTVKDFMKATGDYHDCTEVEDFLDSAPKGMMGYWELIPNKTKRLNIPCKVCNTPESSDLLLLLLNERVKYFEGMRHRKGKPLKITKNDPLFANRQRQFKGFLRAQHVSTNLASYKRQLNAERERVFRYKLEHGEISQETYDETVAAIPNFHAHGLRKFFITTLAKNRVDARISALMEGHKAPIATDSHYVDSDFLKDAVKEEYIRCIPDLSFENVEVRFLTSEERKSLQEKIAELEEENAAMKQDMQEYVDRAVEERMRDTFGDWLKEQGYGKY